MDFPDLKAAWMTDEITFEQMIKISIEREFAAGWYDHYAGETARVKRDWREVLGPGLFPVRCGEQLELAL